MGSDKLPRRKRRRSSPGWRFLFPVIFYGTSRNAQWALAPSLNSYWEFKNTIGQCDNVDGEENYGFKSLAISNSPGATS
jgi:hypothetical protein